MVIVYAVRANGSTINPINLVFDARIVDSDTGGKIVGAVQHQVTVFSEPFYVGVINVSDSPLQPRSRRLSR